MVVFTLCEKHLTEITVLIYAAHLLVKLHVGVIFSEHVDSVALFSGTNKGNSLTHSTCRGTLAENVDVLFKSLLADCKSYELCAFFVSAVTGEILIMRRCCYECATRHGKKVIVMEPVKGGTLADVPEAAEKMFKSYSPDASVASWAIKFAASLPNVFMVLSGMSNMDQMLDNMSYMKDFTPLCDEEYATIEKALNVIKEAVEIPCTACGY